MTQLISDNQVSDLSMNHKQNKIENDQCAKFSKYTMTELIV